MPQNRPQRYTVTPKAALDLEGIWLYSANMWSASQADIYIDELVRIFEMLVGLPEIARERKEFTPPVRLHAHGRHLIVYLIAPDEIVVVRVLGSDQNWQAILAVLD